MRATDYPVCLRLAGRRVLVVGGGVVARSRVGALHDAGAIVTVVAPTVDPAIAALPVACVRRLFLASDLDDQSLVFIATDDLSVSRRVHTLAHTRGLFVNTADVPELCDFTLPAVHRSGAITIAVSTSGHAPAVASRVRDVLAKALPKTSRHLVTVVAALRKSLPAGPARMAHLRDVVHGDVGSAILYGDRHARRRAFARLRDRNEPCQLRCHGSLCLCFARLHARNRAAA